MPQPVRVLIVEDSAIDAELMLRMLHADDIETVSERVDTADELRRALQSQAWDVVLSDYKTPGFGAIAALEIVRDIAGELPFIVVSGSVGEEVVVELMRAGASDYVLKNALTRLGPVVNREFRESKKRRDSERTLRDSEDRYRILLDRIPAPLLVYDRETLAFLAVNAAAVAHYGFARDEFLRMKITEMFPPEDISAVLAVVSNRPETFEQTGIWRHYKKDQTIIQVEVTAHSLELDGRPACVILVHDITDRLRSEAEVKRTSDLLRAVADSTPDAIFVKDRQGRYLLFNPAASRFVGLPVEDVLGRDDSQLFDPIGAQFVMERDRQVMESGQSQTQEEQLTAAGVTRIYLATKAPYWNSEGNIEGVIGISRDITVSKIAEADLLLRDRAMRAVTQGILITDPGQPDNPVIYASPGFERLTGYTVEEALGKNCRFMQGTDTAPDAIAKVREAIRDGESCTVELLNYRKDGTPFWNELSISPVQNATGEVSHFVGVSADVTARRRLEEQLRQSQKMEAVGQLAGGVAHDFNNLLTVIIGYSDILRETLDRKAPEFDLVGEILQAGERAASLTRQLLAFSRQQVLQPIILDLNAVTREMEKMLRRLISENIRLQVILDPKLGLVRADPGQIEQVILNLVVNAKDAMPHGGRLTIETQNVRFDRSYRMTQTELHQDNCVMLSVSDTGHGIPEELRSRIFEPFFTTKEVGKGTGLGLATVHGILKQSGGHIDVQTEIGRGTKFKVYLPYIETSADEPERPTGIPIPPRGTEAVLLVEDEPGVRALIGHVLTGCGYTVLLASNGEDATRVVMEHAGPIQLLVTDVVMPGMGGWQVAQWVRKVYPDIRVLFVSGYTDDAVIRQGVQQEGANFLQKPFSSFDLASKVRDVLDSPL
jgi:two-component system cell cycle sensor histidine kinase/response regulator CckA